MLAIFLRSFNALEFLKLHNGESQVLNRLRKSRYSGARNGQPIRPQVIPTLESFLYLGRKFIARAVYSEKV
jgi:hypothetical protein